MPCCIENNYQEHSLCKWIHCKRTQCFMFVFYTWKLQHPFYNLNNTTKSKQSCLLHKQVSTNNSDISSYWKILSDSSITLCINSSPITQLRSNIISRHPKWRLSKRIQAWCKSNKTIWFHHDVVLTTNDIHYARVFQGAIGFLTVFRHCKQIQYSYQNLSLIHKKR